MTDVHGVYRFGPRHEADGEVYFRLWAPGARKVELVRDVAEPMASIGQGWFARRVRDAHNGSRYRFRIDSTLEVPDPASRFQPRDITGPSELVAPIETMSSQWRGRPWSDAVFVELHIGSFTPEGTFRSAIDRLDHIVSAGFTALQIMPVADFPGRRNWGYDGVLWYAPDHTYGRPEDFRALVNAAHERDLMVFLDVVYNHFGPEGNYLGQYAPEFFTEAKTPWGLAVDYTVWEVRRFAIENALYWLSEFQLDGLRLDAVHAILEPGRAQFLGDLNDAITRLSKSLGRPLHIVLENDDNQASLLDPSGSSVRAQWNDDFHHALHVAVTAESRGYYEGYAASDVAASLAHGFVYTGKPSRHRRGEPRGEATEGLSPLAFVNFIQNHDQIGNRPFGDRLAKLGSEDAVKAALALTVLAPGAPMLFMGDEWGARTPFPFFCDFHGNLADAVREGRKREFAGFFADGEPVPDALEETTFTSAKLNWTETTSPTGRRHLSFVRELIRLRGEVLAPLLSSMRVPAAVHWEGTAFSVGWQIEGGLLTIVANLSPEAASWRSPIQGDAIYGGPPGIEVRPWAVHVMLRLS